MAEYNTTVATSRVEHADNSLEGDRMPTQSNGEILHPVAKIHDLIERAGILLSELEILQIRLRNLRQEGNFTVSRFREAVQSERTSLRRGAASSDEQRRLQIARGSNLPFFEVVWSVCKTSVDIVAISKRIRPENGNWDLVDNVQRLDGGPRLAPSRSRDHAVDVISGGGSTWTKVSLINNTRLLFDLAKQGWQSDESDEDDAGLYIQRQDVEDLDVPLLKVVKELKKASTQAYVLGKHPTVRLVLPRLERGCTAEIDKVIELIEGHGLVVQCKDDWRSPPPLSCAIAEMVHDPAAGFSDTLNIDCTILLALVSDLSHAAIEKDSLHHVGLERQFKDESADPLLPSVLYPILDHRKLVCTTLAAKRMREIVDTIATPSEKVRTQILLGEDHSQTPEQLVEAMQQWSIHIVPGNLQLPVVIVDEHENGCLSELPSNLASICEDLGSGSLEHSRLINKSIFLFGWTMGYTTITSNRAAVRQLEQKLQKLEGLEKKQLPSIWLCTTGRSLVGKEKTGRSRTQMSINKVKNLRIEDSDIDEKADAASASTWGCDSVENVAARS